MNIFVVHYGLNKIKLAFDAQYKIVILLYLLIYLLTYLLSGFGIGLEILASNPSLL